MCSDVKCFPSTVLWDKPQTLVPAIHEHSEMAPLTTWKHLQLLKKPYFFLPKCLCTCAWNPFLCSPPRCFKYSLPHPSKVYPTFLADFSSPSLLPDACDLPVLKLLPHGIHSLQSAMCVFWKHHELPRARAMSYALIH